MRRILPLLLVFIIGAAVPLYAADPLPAPDKPPETAADNSAAAPAFPAPPPAPDAPPATDAGPESTATVPETDTSTPALAPLSGANSLTPEVASKITLAQMGMPQGMVLRGGQLQSGVSFSVPGDVVITHAQLSLNLSVSPALAARGASLLLMMNGQPLGTVPLGSAQSNNAHFQLDIPGPMVVSNNNLSVTINDGDALLCLRDLTDKYQVTVLPDSSVELAGQQLNISADLSHFPRPFFDSQQMADTRLTFAFPAAISPAQVNSAALVASWLGMQAGYRGIRFDALTNTLPEHHGILIGAPGQQIGGITLPQTQGPLLQIIDNPANPAWKLLLIVARDDAGLRAAAWRLTRGQFPLQTGQVAVGPQAIPRSTPYDAPRWIDTTKPVRLADLVRGDQSMTAAGIWHEPLNVSFRAAPDLFLWDGKTIPLQVNYRFPSESWIDEEKSWLNIVFNGAFLRNLPVNKIGILEKIWHKLGGDARQESAQIPLQPYMIYGDNQLSLYFNIVPKADAPCSVLLNNNIKSQIKDDSWIDLSHTRHFTLLPNLSYFVGAAFPFSRLADYSGALMLLPPRPSPAEISTLLDLAARSGNATGTVLANSNVLFGIPEGGANSLLVNDRDILVVSSMAQQAFNQRMLAGSPFVSDNQSLGVREVTLGQTLRRWAMGEWNVSTVDADRYFSSNSDWRGFISFASPWGNGKTVVMATGSDNAQLSRLTQDLDNIRINAAIRGDAAIITDENGVRSFRVGPQYPSGQMPWYMMVVWYANQHSATLAIVACLMCLVVGLGFCSYLRRRVRRRLDPESKEKE
ncbi:cellulose biosynthesis cyclic di-GMP-binding regulatory protein BcsB [Shimwellia pseudoproteus]|uniref:cellulose biosynthesis cyclic di-GMP-binding regulatory protein BcsB n=1 Tax=Shimwellia pseudoproteus TaxID=570012 RepID=UPI0018EB8F1D|nr:cellulose biosynthesis cyclic di-GMP-binding regulatory protein BcsB [Shimwellia pseudoproteus]MBJ3815826.1 cellulose biosynthesis cyclic di-GMP-binding regulatory protein BcsB [Shimwellia pseudoproteus]